MKKKKQPQTKPSRYSLSSREMDALWLLWDPTTQKRPRLILPKGFAKYYRLYDTNRVNGDRLYLARDARLFGSGAMKAKVVNGRWRFGPADDTDDRLLTPEMWTVKLVTELMTQGGQP